MRHLAGRCALRTVAGVASMPDIAIREARRGDLDALLALELASFSGDRLSRCQYRHHLGSRSARVLVAADGDLLGSAVLLLRADSRSARLYSLAVAARARGRGVGSALLEAAIRTAQAAERDGLRLEVRVDNAAAIAFYERHGLRRFGVRRHYYADGADAWRYARDLGPAG